MRAVLWFAGVFALGVIGFSAVGTYDSPLSSPLLSTAVAVISFVCVPLYAALSRNHVVRVWVAFAAPWIAFGLHEWYIDVIHWEHFPSWMLRYRDSGLTAEDVKRLLQ